MDKFQFVGGPLDGSTTDIPAQEGQQVKILLAKSNRVAIYLRKGERLVYYKSVKGQEPECKGK